MLMPARNGCVLHVAGVNDGEALETLCRTTEVIAAIGVDQVLLVLDDGHGADVIWSAALPVEVRPLRAAGVSPFAKVKALRSQLAALDDERLLYAVHLHGAGPCLLGSRALKASPMQRRVLYSPHLAHAASPWTVAVLSRLLQRELDPHDSTAVTASLTEAQAVSKLLKRSAEVLPHPVSGKFFAAARRETAQPTLLVDGFGREAVDSVARLSVLLNGRAARIAIGWLNAAEKAAREQLEAAGVQVLDVADEAERARLLAGAWAYLHLAPGKRLPHGVAEAMAAGAPCLVADTPQHRALVRHGETGFVCTSERDLLEKLILLFRDAAERARLGEAARAEAERRFTARHFERAILRAYGFSTVAAAAAQPRPQLATERNA